MKHPRNFCTFFFLLLACAIAAAEENGETKTPRVQGGMTVSSLRLAAQEGQPSEIIFGNDLSKYKIGIQSNGDFGISSRNSPLLVVNEKDEMKILALNFKTKSLDVGGDIFMSDVPQFRAVVREDFSSGQAVGWDNKASKDIVSNCAGINMLGGFGKFAKGEVTKKFENLPPHSELRVKATFHFIDAWIGETGFMRMDVGGDGNLVHVWTDRHSQDMEQEAVNVCGGAVGEGKFAVTIDLIVPHNVDSVTIGFGSTMTSDDPFDASWGVSGLELYVRGTPKH